MLDASNHAGIPQSMDSLMTKQFSYLNKSWILHLSCFFWHATTTSISLKYQIKETFCHAFHQLIFIVQEHLNLHRHIVTCTRIYISIYIKWTLITISRERAPTIRVVVAKEGGEGGTTTKMTMRKRDGGGSGKRCSVGGFADAPLVHSAGCEDHQGCFNNWHQLWWNRMGHFLMDGHNPGPTVLQYNNFKVLAMGG
ncbi:hypothetical protein EDD16DRAFT_1527451 [Pisolithus croceorrhizus]|nr:hypothetical protein EDD16DRAFT_1527451 [Pisolithus croceorrhizus]